MEIKWDLVDTRTSPTVKIINGDKEYYLHSRYDPIKEAQTWANMIESDKSESEIYVIGIGMGYHIQELSKKYPDKVIQVFEFNYQFLKWLKEMDLLNALLENEKIVLNFDQDLKLMLKIFTKKTSNFKDTLHIYKPSLQLIENEEVKLLLNNFLINIKTIKEKHELLEENFHKNLGLNDPDISGWINRYHKKPMILISAGPSLTKQLPLLKKYSNKGVIIGSVGTALSPLLIAGIKPDFVMISDPKDAITEQFIQENHDDIPLFYLSTANHKAVSQYNGPRFVVWQRGYSLAEIESFNRNTPLVETGGSVATCLLDLMVKLGSNKVALVGQDLAFTNNQSHAFGTHAMKHLSKARELIMVDDYYCKKKINTSLNLYSYLLWFQKYVARNTLIEYFNCTEGGAHIKGFIHLPLSTFIEGKFELKG